MQSNVGDSRVYEAGDQRTSARKEPERFEKTGNEHDLLDSKDNRTLKNRLEEAEKQEAQEDDTSNFSSKTVTDPLAQVSLGVPQYRSTVIVKLV